MNEICHSICYLDASRDGSDADYKALALVKVIVGAARNLIDFVHGYRKRDYRYHALQHRISR